MVSLGDGGIEGYGLNRGEGGGADMVEGVGGG